MSCWNEIVCPICEQVFDMEDEKCEHLEGLESDYEIEVMENLTK